MERVAEHGSQKLDSERRHLMGAKQKLNAAYVNGSLLLAGLAGWLLAVQRYDILAKDS